MLLTITTTRQPATDLSYLLHKHPMKIQQVEIFGGAAHIYYPEVQENRCTVALLLDIDPVGLAQFLFYVKPMYLCGSKNIEVNVLFVYALN